MNTDVERDTLP
jgi:excisionase family DNA binding protein